MVSHSDKIIESAKDLLRCFGYFVDNLWHVEDVHMLCRQKNLPKISDLEAMEVFSIAKEQFDGELGISWPALDRAIRIYIQRKNLIGSIIETTAA